MAYFAWTERACGAVVRHDDRRPREGLGERGLDEGEVALMAGKGVAQREGPVVARANQQVVVYAVGGDLHGALLGASEGVVGPKDRADEPYAVTKIPVDIAAHPSIRSGYGLPYPLRIYAAPAGSKPAEFVFDLKHKGNELALFRYALRKDVQARRCCISVTGMQKTPY